MNIHTSSAKPSDPLGEALKGVTVDQLLDIVRENGLDADACKEQLPPNMGLVAMRARRMLRDKLRVDGAIRVMGDAVVLPDDRPVSSPAGDDQES